VSKRFWRALERDLPGARDYYEYQDTPDLLKSKVLPGSAYSGLLYLNIEEPNNNGGSPTAGRSDLIQKLVADLQGLRAPDSGQPLFTAIHETARLHGDMVDGAPDLILDAYDGEWNIRTTRREPRPELAPVSPYFLPAKEGSDFGWHSRDGLFAFAGSAFAGRGEAAGAHLTDIPATLLFIHDVALPEDMDGQALRGLLSDPLAEMPPRFQTGDDPIQAQPGHNFSDEEADQLLDHLKALGYLE
jgi:predicted AlkP superfamily phosphohydrolase/phosphomutase